MNWAPPPGTGFNGIVARLGAGDGIPSLLWRRRWMILGILVGVVTLTLAALVVIPTRYLATASVIVAETDPNASGASGAQLEKLGDPADLESQLLVVRSPRIMRLAMAMPDFHAAVQREHGGVPFANDDALLDYVQSRYAVSSAGRSRVINISYQSGIPEVAQTLANDLTNAFLEDQRNATSKSRADAANWLWAEVKRLDASLHDDEVKIQAFRRAKGLMRGSNAPISSERLTTVSQQLLAAETARADAGARLAEIKAKGVKNAAEAPAVLSSRAVADVKQQLTLVIGQIASSSSTLGASHPALRALERQRDDLKKRLDQEIAAVAASLQQSYASSDALVASLKRDLEAAKAEVGSATDDEASISNMVRAVDIKRGQYDALYKQASDIETQRRVLVGSTRLVSLAELPVLPFFPRKVPFLAAGLFMGLAAGIAAAILREKMGTLPSPAVRDTRGGLPVLAELPLLQPRLDLRRGLAALSAERVKPTPLGLALRDAGTDRTVQTALDPLYQAVRAARLSRGLRSLAVTSAAAGEGSTFTTLSLAQFAARRGEKVLVIECDPRNPIFEEALQTDAAPGLATLLRDEIGPDEAVMKTSIHNLDAIPAGAPSTQPMDLLFADALPDLLIWAQAYDLVLLDSPPFAMGDDASALAKCSDGVLHCARWDRTEDPETLHAIRTIRAAGGRPIGMAITMVDTATVNQDAHAADYPSYRQAS